MKRKCRVGAQPASRPGGSCMSHMTYLLLRVWGSVLLRGAGREAREASRTSAHLLQGVGQMGQGCCSYSPTGQPGAGVPSLLQISPLYCLPAASATSLPQAA